ncbi:ABC transporter ATP-binding protein/permease [uncultured Sphingomonas sp.]|uniref:ABC transporter ATP-binding protein/permease n=1 Tax=uncultured Sphingomonas sp. TaxID=158754 RepID=UPI0025F36BAC|nr:ABC transporter ATP-binding protein/permease [uncultured Sphingomonas sp.]
MMPQPTQTGEVRRETGLAPPQAATARWRDAWRLVSRYWTSPDWKFAWFALVVLLFFQFGAAFILLRTNQWQRHFFDAIEQRDQAQLLPLLIVFLGIMAMQVAMIVTENLIDGLLSIRWRTFLTRDYLDRWMRRNRYAEIERLRIIDNPDQRIAEDLNNITAAVGMSIGALHIALRLLGAIVSGVTFAMILLETAPPIRFSLGGTAFSIPGSTVWYAVGYALIGSYLTAKIGQPFVRAMMRQQHREADFRAGLIHVRRNAPQIGLADAVATERQALERSFDAVRLNFRSVIYSSLGLTAAGSVYDRLGTVVPLFIMVPTYFTGGMSFGQLMAGQQAFSQLGMQLGYFVKSYQLIGQQVSYFNRIRGLDDALNAARPAGIAVGAGTAPGIVLATEGLALHRPHGEAMVTIGDWSVRAGERWALCGASGTGKSTLIRALAGLWPDGQGRVALANDSRAMFVPQRLYLPLGTLKAAICFPDAATDHDDGEVRALLHRVRLDHLADDVHALRLWQEELSPGEQQRIALARILLHRPDVVVLDEATSALDADNARHFYDSVAEALPRSTVISVLHDAGLLARHTHILTFADGRAHAAAIETSTGRG